MDKDMELSRRLHELMANENFDQYEGGIYDDEFDAKMIECVRKYAEEKIAREKQTETVIQAV